jgi:hypothetical protein
MLNTFVFLFILVSFVSAKTEQVRFSKYVIIIDQDSEGDDLFHIKEGEKTLFMHSKGKHKVLYIATDGEYAELKHDNVKQSFVRLQKDGQYKHYDATSIRHIMLIVNHADIGLGGDIYVIDVKYFFYALPINTRWYISILRFENSDAVLFTKGMKITTSAHSTSASRITTTPNS